ncbi:DinI-like family protein [Klebsiella oxytoca]|uniref:DinI-like family protein n=1 Tax=Klebsiella oxytoca TaxID=571 RepID=A0AAP2BJ72_KLEOX|nr:DinI-like family protein [Klebsiella oxytoca]MBQ0600930.1 DinI-like family protein [Klebsiella oxytoca]
MLRIDVRFDASKKVSAKIQQALRTEIEKEILSNYKRGVVRVGKGSSAEVSITGVDDEEKKAILQRLEDIWMSDNWLPS